MPHHGQWWYFCFVWLLVVLVGFSQNPPAISQRAAFPPNLQHPTLLGLNRKRLSISNDVEEKNIAGSFAPQSCPIHVALQFLCEESCSCTGGYKPEVTNISNSRLRECEMQSCRRQCCTALKLLCKHSISKVQAPECKHNSANNRVQLESKWCRPTEAKLSLFVCPSMNNRRWQTARKKSKLLTAQVLQPIN